MPIEVRDPIYGLIDFQAREWSLVDSPAFQRLRRVQQLAFTHLVYPGARHSRFEHCMGAAHIAGRMAKRLDLPTHDRVRLAALVHDVGHGPFSHVSEMVYEHFTHRTKIHEQISAAIVRHDTVIHAALGDDDAQWISSLLTGAEGVRSVERDIVAGPADIDKLDYLLRDSHYCGVRYGHYDLDKVIESAAVTTHHFGQQTALAFSEEGIFALEEMLLSRYHMHRQVYGHRTRVATDLMLIRAMILGVEEGSLPADIFAPPEQIEADFVGEYVRWDDARVLFALIDAGQRAGEVAAALIDRRLFKRLLRWSAEDVFEHFGRTDGGFILEPTEAVTADTRAEAEAHIAAAANVDPHWVTLHWEHLQNPISTRQSFRIFDSDILIILSDGSPSTFNSASEVFRDVELAGRRFISLFIRPPYDVPFTPPKVEQIRAAAIEALAEIGRASAEV